MSISGVVSECLQHLGPTGTYPIFMTLTPGPTGRPLPMGSCSHGVFAPCEQLLWLQIEWAPLAQLLSQCNCRTIIECNTSKLCALGCHNASHRLTAINDKVHTAYLWMCNQKSRYVPEKGFDLYVDFTCQMQHHIFFFPNLKGFEVMNPNWLNNNVWIHDLYIGGI